jgi:hypothetical protein
MKVVENKWNGNLYEIVKEAGDEIELRRCSDGTIIKIAKSEFTFSYKPSYEKKH